MQRPVRFGMLLIDDFPLIAYASIIEPFRTANLLSGAPLYEWTHLSVRSPTIRASNGLQIMADATIGKEPPLSAVFIVAGGEPSAFWDKAIFVWLRRLSALGTKLVGVSAGTYILARAGLLQGKKITIHWEYVSAFVEEFPELKLEDKLYVNDGMILTCAGGTAGLDLSIDAIAMDHGNAIATAVSEHFIRTHTRISDAPQRLSLRERYGVSNSKLLRVLAHMERAIEEPYSTQELAKIAGVSLRQLERLSRTLLGAPPSTIYRELRLRHARTLLQKSDLSITAIGVASGFLSSSHFSRAFKEQYGRAPKHFR